MFAVTAEELDAHTPGPSLTSEYQQDTRALTIQLGQTQRVWKEFETARTASCAHVTNVRTFDAMENVIGGIMLMMFCHGLETGLAIAEARQAALDTASE